jgi:Putative zinc-finger
VIPDNTQHLTAEDVAAYLDRRLAADELTGLEAHLADCRQCREEAAAVKRMLIDRPIGRPIWLVPIGLAAAAALAIAMLNVSSDPGSPEERLRTPGVTLPAESLSQIAVLSPADGDTIEAGTPAMLWSAVAGEPTYRLTLTDASGQPVWTTTTTDTSVTLPPNVILQPRKRYFWYVDALRADGRAASTGVRRFTTR